MDSAEVKALHSIALSLKHIEKSLDRIARCLDVPKPHLIFGDTNELNESTKKEIFESLGIESDDYIRDIF